MSISYMGKTCCLMNFLAATAQCHMNSANCNTPWPPTGGTFLDCCSTAGHNLTQTSFLSSTGECINCGTMGKG